MVGCLAERPPSPARTLHGLRKGKIRVGGKLSPYLHEKKRSDVEYHPSPGKLNSLLFSSCGHNREDVDRCRVLGAYLDLNDPSGKKHEAILWAWQRARVRRKNKPISPAKHRRRPACLLRMSMKIDSVLRTIAFLLTPHALEERFHFRRPIALPCPGTAHRPGCLQAQAPSVFSQGSCLQVSTEISSKNLGCILVGLIRLISGVCRYFQKPYRLFFLWAWI